MVRNKDVVYLSSDTEDEIDDAINERSKDHYELVYRKKEIDGTWRAKMRKIDNAIS